jgi:hypothetical protein
MQKPCTGCGATKPLEEFPLAKKGKFGRGAKCKTCTALWRSQHKDYLKQYNQQYYAANSEQIKKHVSEYAARTGYAAQKKREPEKKRCRSQLQKAVIKGTIKKLPCFVCGDHAEAHHPDYGKPLEVVWLCKQHHTEVHYGV